MHGRIAQNRNISAPWAIGLAVSLALLVWAAPGAAAEQGWVDKYVELQLRTGAGSNFRIIGSVKTGDRVEIVSRQEAWTQIALPDGKRGWIPAGYLKAEAPPEARLAEAEEELRKLKIEFETVTSDASRLRTNHEEVAARDQQQSEQIRELTMENLELKTGPRWPEWITGASILSVGMLLGALLRGSASRRPSPRIRL